MINYLFRVLILFSILTQNSFNIKLDFCKGGDVKNSLYKRGSLVTERFLFVQVSLSFSVIINYTTFYYFIILK